MTSDERPADNGRPLRVLFVAEQVLGHRTFVDNLRAQLRSYADLQICWLGIDDRYFGPAARGAPWLRHTWPLWSSIQALQAAIRAGRADVLVFHTQTIAQLAWPLMHLTPTIISLDATQEGFASLAAYGDAAPGKSLAHRVLKPANRAVFRSARALLPWSRWAAESLIADYQVDPQVIVVNPPGVDLGYWRRHSGRQAGAPIRVLFVGGDFERKGGPLLLDVLRSISAPWELHLVTSAAIPSSERVRVHRGLASNSPELTALFAGCDVFALPTLSDCFPIASIEAMASGLPVICSDVGGAAEIVAAGETGFLIPPADPDALRASLTALLADEALRTRMGTAGRKRAEAQFDAHARAATVHRLIQTVHARQPASGYRALEPNRMREPAS